MTAASSAARAASHVPGPIERHRVVGELAGARRDRRWRCAARGRRTAPGAGTGTAPPGPARGRRSGRRPPSRPTRRRGSSISSGVVDARQGVVGLSLSFDHVARRAPRAPRGSARRAPAARCPGVRTPTPDLAARIVQAVSVAPHDGHGESHGASLSGELVRTLGADPRGFLQRAQLLAVERHVHAVQLSLRDGIGLRPRPGDARGRTIREARAPRSARASSRASPRAERAGDRPRPLRREAGPDERSTRPPRRRGGRRGPSRRCPSHALPSRAARCSTEGNG